MEILTLWPLSQGEIEGLRDDLVDTLFGGRTPEVGGEQEASLTDRIERGGFPVAVGRAAPNRRRAWFSSYVTSILQRDIRGLAAIERLADLPRLLRLLAARSTGLLNYAELASSAGMPQQTLKRYVALLEAIFFVQRLPAWSRSRGRRLVKSPKVFVTDPGLVCHLLGIDSARLSTDRVLFGALLENLVIMEIVKQLGWSETQASPLHFRDHTGNEVDLVLERLDGATVGIEVKAGATVTSSDFRGLRVLADLAGSDFVQGVLLYGGESVIPFAQNLHAVPLRAVWQMSV